MFRQNHSIKHEHNNNVLPNNTSLFNVPLLFRPGEKDLYTNKQGGVDTEGYPPTIGGAPLKLLQQTWKWRTFAPSSSHPRESISLSETKSTSTHKQ